MMRKNGEDTEVSDITVNSDRSVKKNAGTLIQAITGDTTLPQLLSHWSQASPNNLAYREKDLGIWKRYTWTEYWNLVRRFSLGLKSLGVTPHQRISIASEDTPEWMIADLGIQALGGVTVGIYPTNSWPELQYIVGHSQSRIVVCGDQEQVDKVLDAQKSENGLPDVEWIICVDMKGMRLYDDPRLKSFDDILQLGDSYINENENAIALFQKDVDNFQPDDVAMLVYTSGTTGPPKGAMLSHRNLVISSVAIQEEFQLDASNYSVVCYLPLCHVAERIFSLVLHLLTGGVVNFAESIDTVSLNLREIAPEVFLGVPRIWEKLQQGAVIRMQDASPFQRAVYDYAMKHGALLFAKQASNKGKRSLLDHAHHALLSFIVFKPLQRYMGLDRLNCGFCGGAAISPEVLRFFRVIGVPAYQVYGLTESGGITFLQTPNADEVGCAGLPIPGLEHRLGKDDELEIRYPSVFKGYLNDDSATAATVVDGWLQTGDIVNFTDAGELRIVDRKKAIIITSGGKNISPSEIENALKDSLFIREAIVIGEGKKFLAALIQIDYDTVGKWAQAKGLAYTTFKHLASLEEIVSLIDKEVNQVNKLFARVENIRRFALLSKELDHDDGELTATQKVRRNIIETKFEKEIHSIYGGIN
ncbi:MAG: AMP-binding protein [Pseudomonadales bacterium]|nr:AMP-binding protein [Pseudomonadales bacterium]